MHFIDWLLVVIPLLVVAYAAFKAPHHVKDISDFLAAGRVADRYVLAVSTGQAAMGLISLVASHSLKGRMSKG